MLRAIIIALLILSSVNSYCQLQFDTDTLYSVSKDSGKTFTPIMGQVWFIENDITADTVILTKERIKRGAPRYNFAQNGELEINACFLECGKYICDYFGTWKENDKRELKIYFADEDESRKFNFLFSYEYLDDKRKLRLKKISSDYPKE